MSFFKRELSPIERFEVALKDKLSARQKLAEEWSQFTPAQRAHCVQLSHTGGSPSYVELLTCVEMSKAAADLPSATTGAAAIDRPRAKPSSAR